VTTALESKLAALVRPLLFLDALAFLSFGLAYAIFPELLSAWFGSPAAPVSRVDLAATGGGLQMGLALFLFWQYFEKSSRPTHGLALVALATLGIVLVRLPSMARFAAWNVPNETFLAIELVAVLSNLGLLWAATRSAQRKA
jgi:hypothetical protein